MELEVHCMRCLLPLVEELAWKNEQLVEERYRRCLVLLVEERYRRCLVLLVVERCRRCLGLLVELEEQRRGSGSVRHRSVGLGRQWAR
jgi:hypothetical protein